LKKLDGHVEVHDLGSRTFTFVNGNKIAAPTLIRTGDEVRVGSEVLFVSGLEPGQPNRRRRLQSNRPHPLPRPCRPRGWRTGHLPDPLPRHPRAGGGRRGR
jgi:hypothetical protein